MPDYHSWANNLDSRSLLWRQSKGLCRPKALSSQRRCNRSGMGHMAKRKWKRSNCTSKLLPWESSCSWPIESIAKQLSSVYIANPRVVYFWRPLASIVDSSNHSESWTPRIWLKLTSRSRAYVSWVLCTKRRCIQWNQHLIMNDMNSWRCKLFFGHLKRLIQVNMSSANNNVNNDNKYPISAISCILSKLSSIKGSLTFLSWLVRFARSACCCVVFILWLVNMYKYSS